MMIIDFHTHMYPDKIAAGTVEYLQKKGSIVAAGKGTLADTLSQMEKNQVDHALALNIAINPHNQRKVNDFAIEVDHNNPRIHCFGSVHCHSEEALEELERIKEAGLKGIKFHNEYQDIYVDDPQVYPIYKKCAQLGLMMLFHGGYDIGFPERCLCSIPALAKVIDDFPDNTFIVAHMGGFAAWDEVYDLLCGKENLYLDTSFCAGYLDPHLAGQIIHKHGAHKILFGSDFPWMSMEKALDYIEQIPLTPEEKELIYYQNAAKLLNIQK